MKKNTLQANIFTISLHNFTIHTIIGVLPKEREIPQEIIINIDIHYIYNESILDYAEIYHFILHIFQQNHFLHIEDALNFIQDSLLETFHNITHISICIKKPHILKNCIVSVESTRTVYD